MRAVTWTPGRVLAPALLVAALVGCTVYPISLTPGPRPDPVITNYSRTAVFPVDVELAVPGHLALFTIGADLSMQYPLVPVTRLESIYGAQVAIDNTRILEFRSRHPWPHPDSVPDPFAKPTDSFAAGRHALQRPYAPWIVQDLAFDLPCTYFLLVASDTGLEIHGLLDLEQARLPRTPRDIADAVVRALGLERDDAGWSAQLDQAWCGRPA